MKEQTEPSAATTYARIARSHVEFLRVLLQELKDEDRVQVFDSLREGYCRACGRALRNTLDFCQCENDE